MPSIAFPDLDESTVSEFFDDDLLMVDESQLSPVTSDDTQIRTGLKIVIDAVFEDKQSTLEFLRSTPPRNRRSTTPQITNVLPTTGSPRGGQIITIVGTNLESNQLDLGGGVTDSSVPGNGDDYFFYFEKSGFSPVECRKDRMLNLLARQLGQHQSIFCITNKVRDHNKLLTKNPFSILLGKIAYFG